MSISLQKTNWPPYDILTVRRHVRSNDEFHNGTYVFLLNNFHYFEFNPFFRWPLCCLVPGHHSKTRNIVEMLAANEGRCQNSIISRYAGNKFPHAQGNTGAYGLLHCSNKVDEINPSLIHLREGTNRPWLLLSRGYMLSRAQNTNFRFREYTLIKGMELIN